MEHFTILHPGEPKTSRRIAMKISQDNKLRENIRKIENKLKLSRMKTPFFSFVHYNKEYFVPQIRMLLKEIEHGINKTEKY